MSEKLQVRSESEKCRQWVSRFITSTVYPMIEVCSTTHLMSESTSPWTPRALWRSRSRPPPQYSRPTPRFTTSLLTYCKITATYAEGQTFPPLVMFIWCFLMFDQQNTSFPKQPLRYSPSLPTSGRSAEQEGGSAQHVRWSTLNKSPSCARRLESR